MAKVFLSHSSTDKPFVRKIKKILYPFGAYSWLDEQELFPGDKLWETILKGIDSSDKAIVFVTSNSQDSDWVQKEVKEFIEKEEKENQSKVIPVIFTPNPPDFLTERLYINFNSRPFSNCIKDLLIGINRNKSVIVIEPLKNEPYKLESFKEELTSHKKSAEKGDLIFVYDYYSLLDNILESLLPDEYHFSEKLKVVIPRMFEFLTALTPRLLKTIFNYYKNDPSVYFVTETIIQFIWHSLFFQILNKLEIYGDKNKLLESDYNFTNCFEEYNRVIELGKEKIPNSHVGVKHTILWLDHLKSDWENTYDIGFRGSKTESGEQIYDANHVRIRQCDIRPDSLTVFNDTTPDQEFMIFVWVNNILPYIAMDSIVQASNADLDIFETIPRIGLKKNDYYYFGIE